MSSVLSDDLHKAVEYTSVLSSLYDSRLLLSGKHNSLGFHSSAVSPAGKAIDLRGVS